MRCTLARDDIPLLSQWIKNRQVETCRFLVRVRGLEPPPNCSDMNLNHTRLPVPPYPHIELLSAWDELHYTAGGEVCQGVLQTFFRKVLIFFGGAISFKNNRIKIAFSFGFFLAGAHRPGHGHRAEKTAQTEERLPLIGVLISDKIRSA